MLGAGATETLTLSDCAFVDVAFTKVAHGVAADPPYVTAAVTEVWPVGIVTFAGTATQAALAAVSATATPGAGAEIGEPPLRSWIVMVPPYVALIESALSITSSWAVVVARVTSVTQPGAVAVIVAAPGVTPESVPLARVVPCGNVTVVVTTLTREGSLLTRVTVTPPAGAGVANCTGMVVVRPYGTLSVVGRLMIWFVATTGSEPWR